MTKAGLEPLKASTGVAVACAVIGAGVVVCLKRHGCRYQPLGGQESLTAKEVAVLQARAFMAGDGFNQISSESVNIELADDGRPAPAALPGDCCVSAVAHSVAGWIRTARN